MAKQVSEIASFTVPIQADPSIEEVQVLGGSGANNSSAKSRLVTKADGSILGSKTASQNAPTVTVQYPNGGDNLSGDEIIFEWTGDDPDEDSLSYTVQYSRDGGTTWKALATGWPHDTLSIEQSSLGATSEGVVRIEASDGFNTDADTSDGTFTTSNSPPNAQIFSPSEGVVVDTSSLITLDGAASDVEDGQLSGPSLKWKTNSGDTLGIGRTLDVPASTFSLGTQSITLTATDSAGQTDTASVSIQVATSSDPSLVASQSAFVDSSAQVDFGGTETNINFSGVSGSGNVTVELYGSPPVGADSIPESNISEYRIIVDAGDNISIGPDTEVRFEADSLGGIGNPTKIAIYRRSTPGNGSFSSLTTRVDSSGSADEIYATVSQFSEFVLASDSEPLPVELSHFQASLKEGRTVRLAWKTASEKNNAGFRVQRMEGAPTSKKTWKTIGRVRGQGTTAEPTSYQFEDGNLPYQADQLTYRLKQIDTGGSVSYSKKITVERTVDKVELRGTYPNPARQRATLRYAVPEQQDVTIRLYDVLGRRVRTVVDGQKEGRKKIQMDVSSLASGVYFLRLRSEGEMRIKKLTVVK